MSNYKNPTAFVFTGILLGLALPGCSANDSEAIDQPVAELAPRLAVEPAPEEIAQDAIELVYSSSAALGEGESVAYGRFQLAAADNGTSTGEIRLHIEPGPGVAVKDVVGAKWVLEGRSVVVSVQPIPAGSISDVIVQFRLASRDTGSIQAHVEYLDAMLSRPRQVTTEAIEGSVSVRYRDAKTLVRVREAYTDHTISWARELSANGDRAEARAWVADARAANVEIGRVMRVSKDLAPAQERLAWLAEELAYEKPRVKRVRKPAKETIEIVRGDAPNSGGKAGRSAKRRRISWTM